MVLIVILQRLMRSLQSGASVLGETPSALKFSPARLLHPYECIAIRLFRRCNLSLELGS